jgi:hypothetical protein
VKEMNKNLKNYLESSGQILDIGKNEIKAALQSRKHIVVAIVILALTSIFAQAASYGTLRYAGASIYDFLEFGKFL